MEPTRKRPNGHRERVRFAIAAGAGLLAVLAVGALFVSLRNSATDQRDRERAYDVAVQVRDASVASCRRVNVLRRQVNDAHSELRKQRGVILALLREEQRESRDGYAQLVAIQTRIHFHRIRLTPCEAAFPVPVKP